MINPMELTGKHVVVTGASSGIGRATAIMADALGARLTLVARREEKLHETMNQLNFSATHKMYVQDLCELHKIEDMLEHIVEQQGKVDGFVHCAGVAPIRPVALTKIDFMNNVLQINFCAFAECVRILTKKKFSNDNASLVGISSTAARRGNKAQSAYAASKGAIEGFIHPVAKEVASRKIRINAIEFGMIETDLYKQFLKDEGDESILNSHYLGIGQPRDAALSIAFLLSDASRYVTGSVLIVDGGYLS